MEEKEYKAIYSSKDATGNGATYFDTAEVGGIVIEIRNF
jgi:hypothetical protein